MQVPGRVSSFTWCSLQRLRPSPAVTGAASLRFSVCNPGAVEIDCLSAEMVLSLTSEATVMTVHPPTNHGCVSQRAELCNVPVHIFLINQSLGLQAFRECESLRSDFNWSCQHMCQCACTLPISIRSESQLTHTQ